MVLCLGIQYVYVTKGYGSSLNIFGLQRPYKEMYGDTSCSFSCTFQLFNAYGNIVHFRFVKAINLIISIRKVSLHKVTRCAVKTKLEYKLMFLQSKEL